MKWFEKVVGKEKIIHMFNGEIELNNIILSTLLCYDYKLDVVVYLLDIPNKVPDKWERNSFNAIKINLEFFNLNEVKFYSKGIHRVNGKIELNFLKDKVEFNFINKNEIVLFASSDVVRIAEINPVKIDI